MYSTIVYIVLLVSVRHSSTPKDKTNFALGRPLTRYTAFLSIGTRDFDYEKAKAILTKIERFHDHVQLLLQSQTKFLTKVLHLPQQLSCF